MNERIAANPNICHGQPCIRGTRIMVYLILELLEAGLAPEDIIKDYYPNLAEEDIKACLSYAASLVKDQEFVPFEETSQLRFLADENVYPKVVSHLREMGHDVKDIKSTSLSKATDDEIMEFARKQERALVTFDKHFANTLRYPPENNSGIIVVRIHPPILEDVVKALGRLLRESNLETLKGRLIVLTKKGYRIRGIVK